MKTLQITSDYFGTRVYQNLFSALEKINKNRVLIPMSKNEEKNYGRLNIPKNVSIIFLGKIQMFGIQINALKYFKYCVKKKLCDGIEIVHAHYVFCEGSIARKIYKRYGIPYVVSVRATCIMEFNRKFAFHNYITGLEVLNDASAIFFQSPKALTSLLDKIPGIYRNKIINKHIIISNGIENFWLKNIALKSKKIDNVNFVVITAASIEHNKNLINIAKVISKMNDSGYNIQYNIAGKILDRIIYSDLKQYSFINYLGNLNNNELLIALRHSDIFVMVSHSETFGLVYAEAMSQALPVVYTKGEGFDGQFNEGTVGYHASSNSLFEIERAILRTVENYPNLSTNALKYAKKFDWNKIAYEYHAAYSNVVNI